MTAVYSARNNLAIEPQPAQPPKLLDRLRHVLRAKHYSKCHSCQERIFPNQYCGALSLRASARVSKTTIYTFV